MRRIVPCIAERLEFMQSVDWILRESSGHIADSEYATDYKEYRGSSAESARDLPWRDVDQSLLIAVAETAGADVALALTSARAAPTRASSLRPGAAGLK